MDCLFLNNHAATEVRVEARGFRIRVVVLPGAALEPAGISEVKVETGTKSLSHLLAKPYCYSEDPELFCQVLYPEFELVDLVPLAEPIQVGQRFKSSDSGD